MSKRSQFKIHQRVREGVEGRRRVQLHVLRVLTEKVADTVAAKLRSLVIQEVHNELDRRGYNDTEKETHGDIRGNLVVSTPPINVSQGTPKDREETPPQVAEREECPRVPPREEELPPACPYCFEPMHFHPAPDEEDDHGWSCQLCGYSE